MVMRRTDKLLQFNILRRAAASIALDRSCCCQRLHPSQMEWWIMSPFCYHSYCYFLDKVVVFDKWAVGLGRSATRQSFNDHHHHHHGRSSCCKCSINAPLFGLQRDFFFTHLLNSLPSWIKRSVLNLLECFNRNPDEAVWHTSNRQQSNGCGDEDFLPTVGPHACKCEFKNILRVFNLTICSTRLKTLSRRLRLPQNEPGACTLNILPVCDGLLLHVFLASSIKV